MAAPQYAVLRFAKYKGPEISGVEAHNERTKEKYASNPDIDHTRTHLNFHLIKPERKYRAESEKQIAEAGCRTRSDSVRVVEALITATPEFFKGKKRAEIKEFFSEALEFIKQNRAPETIISAVVHLDEKNPHMHLCFVPLTEDKRLSAKEILGNKKKLTQWQDKEQEDEWRRLRGEYEPEPTLENTSFYVTEPDGTKYFYCGNTRTKVTEFFSPNGQTLDKVIENLVRFAAGNTVSANISMNC